MTPNDLNRRIVADWLRGTSEGCHDRSMRRMLPGNNPPWIRCASGVLLILVWSDCFGRTSTGVSGRSRAEATAKAAEWILRNGWEVTSG